MTGGDGGLHRVRTGCTTEHLRPLEGGEAAADEQLIPPSPVLVEQQDGFAGRTDPRPRSRRLDLHQGDESVDLCFLRGELGQDATEAKGVLTKGRSHPILSGRRRVALVEHEVDDLEHR